jgi:selenocysteine lyase/cysteine desulfurase
MAAPSLLFPPSEVPASVRDFAAEASLARVRAIADVARDRIAELDGVRVIGPEISATKDSVRLAVDLRDTGRDAWRIACALATRGFAVEANSHRVMILRLRDGDLREGTHERIAPALLMALWAEPAMA